MSSLLGLALPRLSSAQHAISLTVPYTPRSLVSIKSALAVALQSSSSPTLHNVDDTELNAAVLVPLANVNEVPGVILELRGPLRSHGGEVSFPGGRADNGDASHLATALREVDEEITVKPGQVEILGELGPPQRSLSGLRVWPYVGFVHSTQHSSSPATASTQPHIDTGQHARIDMDMPFPSLSMSSLHASAPEVAHVFHLPLAQLVQPARLRPHQFRGERPYWAIEVTDIVASSAAKGGGGGEADGRKQVEWAGETNVDEVGGGRGGKLEVWGLTGWYLNLLMRALGVYV